MAGTMTMYWCAFTMECSSNSSVPCASPALALISLSECPQQQNETTDLAVNLTKITSFQGKKRVYYVAAVEEMWDYFPLGVNGMTGLPITSHSMQGMNHDPRTHYVFDWI
jgi:hypothetical protein